MILESAVRRLRNHFGLAMPLIILFVHCTALLIPDHLINISIAPHVIFHLYGYDGEIAKRAFIEINKLSWFRREIKVVIALYGRFRLLKKSWKETEINIFKMYIITENKLKCKTENLWFWKAIDFSFHFVDFVCEFPDWETSDRVVVNVVKEFKWSKEVIEICFWILQWD